MTLPVSSVEAMRRWHAIETHPSIAAAARSLNMRPGSLREWIACHPRPLSEGTPLVGLDRRIAGVALVGLPPQGATEPVQAVSPVQPVIIKPTYRVAMQSPDGAGKTRVVVIGDAHDAPSLPDKSRFRRIGAYVADTKPDLVIQIGDMASVDSLSRHDRNETHIGRSKPTFLQDVESLGEALAAFNEGLNGYAVERHQTEGNHEKRAWAWMNNNPEVAGMVDQNINTVLGDYGWTQSPFGALHFVGGVAFTHAPLNTMGREYGGMYAENQIARDSLHSVVYGHSHKPLHKSYPKLGHRRVQVLNVGCFLPDGHIEHYAQHSLTGWGFGFYDVTIERGDIQLADWRPMTWLEERYS